MWHSGAMNHNSLTFAIPKGRIYEELAPLMQSCDIHPEHAFFDDAARQLIFATNQPHIRIIRVRSFDVATFVTHGAADIGVVGSDALEEFSYPDIYAPVDLGIGTCRLSVAEPEHLAHHDNPDSWTHIRIATKYPNITKRYFHARGIQAECVKLNGAMEIAPLLGLSERIVDLVSTGNTLKANGLVEVQKIMDVSSRLIVNRQSYKADYAKLHEIISIFRATLSKKSAA
jgi:ATP phosphoribosyltransferase